MIGFGGDLRMSRRFPVFLAGLCLLFLGNVLDAGVAIVDFESLAVGTRYGMSEGDSPGGPAFDQNGIAVTLENYHNGSFTGFFRAEVQAGGSNMFATRHLYIDNINIGFDFTGVGFPVNQVSVDYHEFGGVDNFSVNGGPVIEYPSLTDLPTMVVSGVTAAVDADSIVLSGPIARFQIGGQELVIDNIVAVPEPVSLTLLGIGLIALRGMRQLKSGH